MPPATQPDLDIWHYLDRFNKSLNPRYEGAGYIKCQVANVLKEVYEDDFKETVEHLVVKGCSKADAVKLANTKPYQRLQRRRYPYTRMLMGIDQLELSLSMLPPDTQVCTGRH